MSIKQNGLINYSVFPNPSNGAFNIHFSKAQDATIQVFDAVGKEVLEANVENENTMRFNLKKKAGIYTIVILTESDRIVERLIVK